MALFEKRRPGKVTLDDTESLTCIIENFQTVSGHTEYVLKVHRGTSSDRWWHVLRRYSDFSRLNSTLEACGSHRLPLPPKKLLGNMDRGFVAERMDGLQLYLDTVLGKPCLAMSLPVRRFLDPDNYSQTLHEPVLQHVSMLLRSEDRYELVSRLPDIGWRIRKHYFLARSRLDPTKEKILSWVDFGPDKHMDERDIQHTLRTLSSMRHPHILPPEHFAVTDTGAMTVRPFLPSGSLWDAMGGADPKAPFLKKCARGETARGLSPGEVRLYGRQVLEALASLEDKGIPYGNLHARNVSVESGRAMLIDVEGGVLGLPSYYRQMVLQHRKVGGVRAADVYCFGHLLYEMAFGRALEASCCHDFPAECSPMIRAVLESILSPQALKNGLPTIGALLSEPLFDVNGTCLLERPVLKLPAHTKQALCDAIQKMDTHLQEEQRSISKQKRMARAHEKAATNNNNKKKKKKETLDVAPNDRSSDRSDSPNSVSTANSASPPPGMPGHMGSNSVPPPPPPPPHPPPPPPPPPPATAQNDPPANVDRANLLSAIRCYSKAGLKKAATLDKSVPTL